MPWQHDFHYFRNPSIFTHRCHVRDIWPSHQEIAETIKSSVLSEMFREVYGKVTQGTPQWNSLQAPTDKLYPWDEKSTYIHNPPFFADMEIQPKPQTKIDGARVLLLVGDFITTDHISPAGNISIRSPGTESLATYLNFCTHLTRRAQQLLDT